MSEYAFKHRKFPLVLFSEVTTSGEHEITDNGGEHVCLVEDLAEAMVIRDLLNKEFHREEI